MMESIGRDGEYYTDKDVAQLLGISVARLRNKLTAGNPLPPRIQPPGCRNRLWPRAAVHEWLQQFIVAASPGTSWYVLARRRGRPTKEESRARRS